MTTTLNQGLFRREDESLRRALNNVINVTDRHNGARAVPAYFRMQLDQARSRLYPYILIDNLGISRDPTREHRGGFYTDGNGYFPMGVPAAGAVGRADLPIPMIMRYQVSIFSRFEQHDRAIQVGLMMTPVLRPRFGSIDMVETRTNPDTSVYAPDDNSMRRVDIMDGPTPQDANDEDGKRLFSARWSIEISTELFESDFDALGLAGTIVIDPATQGGFSSLT